MRNVARWVASLLVLGLIALLLFFVLENQQSVSLVFFGWVAPALPVAVLVLMAGCAGLVVGPLLGIAVAARAKRRSQVVSR